jgi:hypothetical protein
MDDDSFETADQQSEIHFLAALTDELMRALGETGALTRAQLNGIEEVAAKRAGTIPRPW